MANEEDRDLLLAYSRRGDVHSLSVLVRRHAVWMQTLVRGMLPTAADAEDAFQEAWMRVIKSAAGYRGGSVRAYLASAARSAAIDRLRRGGRAPVLFAQEPKDAPPVEDIPDAGASPVEHFESKATAEDVRLALRTLPEGPRQVLLMRVEAELTFREIASELDIPLGTALTWMRMATQKLKELLGG